MAAPAIRVPIKSKGAVGTPRKASPALRIIKARARLRSSPKRRANQGAKGAKSPRQSTGRVVSNESVSTDSSPSFKIRGTSGAREDKAGRRFKPTNTIRRIKLKRLGFLR